MPAIDQRALDSALRAWHATYDAASQPLVGDPDTDRQQFEDAAAEALEAALGVYLRDHVALDLAELRAANVARMHRWHGEKDDWTLADWSNAMCGEAGEAANVVKKIRRRETGLAGQQHYNTPDWDALAEKLADECADVLCYLDLLAHKAGIDLASAAVAKFNRVSEAQGFPERIGVSRDATPAPERQPVNGAPVTLVDFAAINNAIVERWSLAALKYIKTRAWQLQ